RGEEEDRGERTVLDDSPRLVGSLSLLQERRDGKRGHDRDEDVVPVDGEERSAPRERPVARAPRLERAREPERGEERARLRERVRPRVAPAPHEERIERDEEERREPRSPPEGARGRG